MKIIRHIIPIEEYTKHIPEADCYCNPEIRTEFAMDDGMVIRRNRENVTQTVYSHVPFDKSIISSYVRHTFDEKGKPIHNETLEPIL